ncbi:unnamed protein product [Phytomonas sp. Hart1]|nr:unnamed protein product [Phytomonas sp. Hart1]|eukprot:CCW66224.1 unnamed protein product [Phytomonas sp. isolate Hart1]
MSRNRTEVAPMQTDSVRSGNTPPHVRPFSKGAGQQNSPNTNGSVVNEKHKQDNNPSPLLGVNRENGFNISKEPVIVDGIPDYLSHRNVPSKDLTGTRPPTRIGGDHPTTGGYNQQTENPHCEKANSNLTPTINRLARLSYFCFMFGLAGINAYFGSIFSDKGISKRFIGFLLTITPLSSVLILPIFSFIADKYHCSILMLVIAVIGSTISVWFFTTTSNHAVLISAFVILVICQTPVNPLIDRNMLVMFTPEDKATRWAFIRSFGTMGCGVGNVVASVAAYFFGSWSIGVIQYTVGHVGMLLCLWFIKSRKSALESTRGPDAVDLDQPANDDDAEEKVRFIDMVRILIRNPRLLVFLMAASATGMGYSIVTSFLFIFLKELGASVILFGVAMLMTVSTEIPIFLCFEWIQDWFTERTMLTIAMAMWAIRTAGYSILPNPWLVLLLEPLHGITFGFTWLPGVKTISAAFPPQLSASATGVLFFFVVGLGPALGCSLSGLLNDAVGSKLMFRICSITMVGLIVAYQLIDRGLARLGWELCAVEPGSGGRTPRTRENPFGEDKKKGQVINSGPMNPENSRSASKVRLKGMGDK